MDSPAGEQVTRLLNEAALGEAHAGEELLPLVYEQLRELARCRMANEQAGHTLQATALVHEAYLRLVGNREVPWSGRGQFFAAAAQAMRRILTEHARAGAVHHLHAGTQAARIWPLTTTAHPHNRD